MSGVVVKRVLGPFTLAELAQAVVMRVEDIELYEDCGVLQPARRRLGRADRTAYHAEHVERLRYIKRALGCGLTIQDILALLDPAALLPAKDVRAIVQRRLSIVRQTEGEDGATTQALENLLQGCPGTGARRDCSILKTLAGPG